MYNALTIAKRDFKSYFYSPIAYIVVGAFLLVAGYLFFGTFFIADRAEMRAFFQPTLLSPSALLLILIPAITMRSIAEERKRGMFELLTTMPIRDFEVILGKFLGALSLVAVALGITIVFALSVSSVGDLDWGPVLSGYFGLFLFSAALVALGLLASALSADQVVAFILAFIFGAALYYLYILSVLFPDVAGLIERASMWFHLENMAKGVVDSRGVLFFVSLTVGALFLAERALKRLHA